MMYKYMYKNSLGNFLRITDNINILLSFYSLKGIGILNIANIFVTYSL